MNIIHYSHEPFTFRDKKYRTRHYTDKYAKQNYIKPGGLWVSIEDKEKNYYDWQDWCKDADFRLERLKHKYSIEIRKDASILELTNVFDMFGFNNEYAIPEENDHGFDELDYEPIVYKIKWNEVAAKWQGVFIYPYHNELRLRNDFTWYYGWDCSSGVIWDLDAIKEVKEVNNE